MNIDRGDISDYAFDVINNYLIATTIGVAGHFAAG